MPTSSSLPHDEWTLSRRSAIVSLLALSGCVGAVDPQNQTNTTTTNTTDMHSEKPADMNDTTTTTDVPQVTEIFESATAASPDERPPESVVKIVENSDAQTVTISKITTAHNSCATVDYAVDTTTPNQINVQFSSVDTSPENVSCATVIRPTPLAVELQFSELPADVEIVVTPVYDSEVRYTTIGKSQTTSLPL